MIREPFRWLVLLCFFFVACGGSGGADPADARPAADAAWPDAGAVGDLAAGPRAITLPADEAPHGDPMEWWYYTGRLVTEQGEVYGFLAVIFQIMFLPGKPLYVANAALADVAAGQHLEQVSSSAVAQPQPAVGFALSVGRVHLAGHEGVDRVEIEVDGARLELDLRAAKAPVIQYGTGYMTIGADEPFYYYSYTRMAASGALTRDGQRQVVVGEAWMDHQWGTIGRDFGWDWFSLRFADETELMLFAVKRAGETGFVGGTFVAADGASTPLSGADFVVTATGSWQSPQTDNVYPHGWRVEVPSRGIDVELRPVLADQEFDGNITGAPIYWEGLCDIVRTGGGGPVVGHAYVEITAPNW